MSPLRGRGRQAVDLPFPRGSMGTDHTALPLPLEQTRFNQQKLNVPAPTRLVGIPETFFRIRKFLQPDFNKSVPGIR